MIEQWLDSNNWSALKGKTNQVIDLINSMTNAIVPVGAILPYYGDIADPNFFTVSGIGVADSAMEKFALCYGQGLTGSLLKNFDGTPRSVTPNLVGRFLYGVDPLANALGQTAGVSEVTLTALQSGMRDHVHLDRGSPNTVSVTPSGNTAVPVSDTTFTQGALNSDGVSGRNGNQPAQEAHTNMPPYMVVAYIIRYK